MKIKKQEQHLFFINKDIIVLNQKIEQIKEYALLQLNQNKNDIKYKLILIQILYTYENDYKKALTLIREVLIQDPLNVDAYLDLLEIMIEFDVGTNEQCKMLLNQILEKEDNYWRIYYIKIRLLDHMDMSDLAIMSEIKEDLIKFPQNIWLTTYYYQIATEEGKLNIVDVPMELLLSSKYLDFELLRRLSYIFHNLGQSERNLEFLKYALELNPNSYNCLNNYGYFLKVHQNKNDECLQYQMKSIQQNPRFIASLSHIAASYQKMDDFEQSNIYFKKCIEICKYRPNLYTNLISNYFQQDNYLNGKYYAYKGVKNFPYNPQLNMFYVDMIKFDIGENYEINDLEDFEIYSQNSLKFSEDVASLEFLQAITYSLNEAYENYDL